MSKCPHCLDGLGSYNCFCTGQTRPDEQDRRAARPAPTGEKVEAVALTSELLHLVSLNDQSKGGPYQGYAAQACVKAMTNAVAAISALVAERDEALVEMDDAERQWCARLRSAEMALAAANARAERLEAENKQLHAALDWLGVKLSDFRQDALTGGE